jgi:hypothetical protein
MKVAEREERGTIFSGPGSSASVDMTSTAVGPSLVKNPPLILSIPSHSYTTSTQEKRTRTRRKKILLLQEKKKTFFFLFFCSEKKRAALIADFFFFFFNIPIVRQ